MNFFLILDYLRKKRAELLILAGMVAMYFFSYVQRIAVPGTIFNELQLDFNTSAAAITALGAVFLYVYGFCQIFTGALTDRFGGARMLLVGSTLMCVGTLLFPLARSLPLLYATRVLVAFGASFIILSIIKEIDALFDLRHFAMLYSLTLFFGYSGGLFGTLPIERAVHWFGWRASFFGVGLLGAGALLGNVWLSRKIRHPDVRRMAASRLFIWDILRNRRSWFVVVTYAINFAVYFMFQATIGKKMLSDICAIGSAQAASIMFVMMAICMLFTSSTGFLSRLIGNRRKPLIIISTSLMLSVVACMLWGLSLPGGAPHLTAALLILLGLSGAFSPIFVSLIKEVNPAEAAASSVGFGNCLCYVFVAVITNLAGMTMDAFRAQAVVTPTAILYPVDAYRVILSGCLIAAAVAWLCSLCISETRGQCVPVSALGSRAWQNPPHHD